MLQHPELTVIIEKSNQTPEQDRTNEGHKTLMTMTCQIQTETRRQQANIVSIPAQDLV